MKANTKECGRCKKNLPFNSYYKQSNTRDGKSNYCKECKKEYQRERNKKKFKENPPLELLYKSCRSAIYRSKPSYKEPGYAHVTCQFENVKAFVYALWDDELFRNQWISQTDIFIASNNYKDRPTLDRINPNLGYEKDNIRMLPQYINVSRGFLERKTS